MATLASGNNRCYNVLRDATRTLTFTSTTCGHNLFQRYEVQNEEKLASIELRLVTISFLLLGLFL